MHAETYILKPTVVKSNLQQKMLEKYVTEASPMSFSLWVNGKLIQHSRVTTTPVSGDSTVIQITLHLFTTGGVNINPTGFNPTRINTQI